MPQNCDWFSANGYQSFQMEQRSVRGVTVETDASVFRFTGDKITLNFTIILFLLVAGDFWTNPVSAKFFRDEGDWALMFGQPSNANLGLDASWWLGSQLFLTGHNVKGGEELCAPSSNIHSFVFSLRGRVGSNQSPVMWPVWLWHTASRASSWG